jgi:phage tail tube protein FII
MKKTHVSVAGSSDDAAAADSVATASLAEHGATMNKYSGGGMQGFVLDLPEGMDEQEAILKLANSSDVMRVVPDTWVGIAAAAGACACGEHRRHNHQQQQQQQLQVMACSCLW